MIENLKIEGLNGKNIVCTDPKGEIYSKTSEFFKTRGYKVKVFNTVHPEHSDGIDLIKLIETELDAQIFAQTVISTTQNEGKKGEEFWQNNQENLLKALLLHIRFEVEDKTKQNMRYLTSILASGDISTIDRIFKNSKGPTKIAYNLYSEAQEVVKLSTIIGLATKIQILQLEDVAMIVEKDDIDFNKLNDEKTIIYCITSDTDTTMSFISSLFFSFLFIKTIRTADSNINGKLKRPLFILLDEFPNIGKIPDFDKKLATIRSRDISATIVSQNLAGLKAMYENDIWENLIGNTDIRIVMGTNDLLTAKYISETLGVATVETKGNKKEAGFDGALEYGQENTSTIRRNLLNPDEIMRMDNSEQIIMLRGYKPFKCKKLRYWEYRLGVTLKEVSVLDYIPKNNYEAQPIIEEKNEDEKVPNLLEFIRMKGGLI